VSLTGRPVLWLSAVLALLAPVAAVVLWDRVRGSRWRQVLGRLALLGMGEMAALVFAFVALNDYAGFVDSWSQAVHFVTGAFGHEKVSAATNSENADASASPDPTAAPGDFRLSTQQAPSPAGHIWRILGDNPPEKWVDTGVTVLGRFDSGPVGEEAYIYLPPQYFGPHGRRDLPMLEEFTGSPGPTDYLVSKLHTPDVVLSGIKSGEIAPMVVVMMRPDAAGGWNTACTDVPNGPQVLTYYTKDLPAGVRQMFGLHPAPELAIGYAEGGYCAAKLALLDPTDFRAAAEMAGTFHPPTDASTRGIFADQNVREQNDLGWRLQNLPVPAVSLLLTTARDDDRASDGHAVAEQWLGLTHPPITSAELVLDHNGHNYPSYEHQLLFDLSWLSGKLPAGGDSHLAAVPSEASLVAGAVGPEATPAA
jgi:hypothetical protein